MTRQRGSDAPAGAAPSLRRRLVVGLILAIASLWLVVVVLVYRAAQHEVEEVFDADLVQSARTLQALLRHETGEEAEMAARAEAVAAEVGEEGLRRYPALAAVLRDYAADEPGERIELPVAAGPADHPYTAGLFFIARHADGEIMVRSATAPGIGLTEPGFVDLEAERRLWRVYRLTDGETGLHVQVGERHAFRAELVRYITRNSLLPLLVAMPLLALAIWLVVGRALAPLARVAGQVSLRDPDALDAIAARDAPREIRSLVDALNTLFGRMTETLERERRFTADAAHELRTPIAAAKTHIQVAAGRPQSSATARSLAMALESVDRAAHAVDQMLALVRVEAGRADALDADAVDLRALCVSAVTQASQSAMEHGIDLGVDAPAIVRVRGDAPALAMMLRNLVDNAVRYTPPGGVVTVACGAAADAGWIEVVDDGPGIPAADRERVFDRFYRGTGEQAAGIGGTGIGLSIVQRIVQLHGGVIALGDGVKAGPTRPGLRVRVELPVT